MKALVGIALLWGLLMAVRYAMVSVGFYGLPAAIMALGVLTLVVIMIRPVADLLEEGAGMLLEYMPLFFIPILVGVTARQQLLVSHWVLIMFTVVGASLIGLLSAAYAYRFVSGRGGDACPTGASDD